MKWLWDYAQEVATTYGADPRIYLGLVLVTIPPFYLAFGIVVRDLMRTRRETGTLSVSKALSRPSFGAALVTMLALWLVPYVYVLLWGRDLPVWLIIVFLALIIAGGVSLAHRVRRRAASSAETEEL